MGKDAWAVLPHGPLEKLNDSVWRLEGEMPSMKMKRVMTLARLADDKLLVHNGVSSTPEVMAQIEAWGEPAWLVVPCAYHRMDAAAWKARYPDIKVLCPEDARKAVERVVPVDGLYEDFPEDPVAALETLDGVGGAEGVLKVRAAEDDLTLVFNDLIFNMPHGEGIHGLFYRHVSHSSGGPRVSRIGRYFLIKEKASLQAHLTRLAGLPGLRRAIVAHHEMITGDVPAVLSAVSAAI